MMERPILFSSPMVRAILAGQKSQTRRVVKPRGVSDDIAQWLHTMAKGVDMLCPYGQPGDRLWVRETWKCEELEPSGEDGVRFKADGVFRMIENSREASEKWVEASREGGKWRPSIFMPRWASRITLEIVNVRVERVQNITRDDAKAEGVSNVWSNPPANEKHFQRGLLNPYIANYSVLWDEINVSRGFGWDINPWVWVVDFKVVQ